MMSLIPNTHSVGYGLGSWPTRRYRRPKHPSAGIAYTTKHTPYRVGAGHIDNTPHTGSSSKHVPRGNLFVTPHAKRRAKQAVIHGAKRIKVAKGVKHTPLKKTVSRKSVRTNKNARGANKSVTNKTKNIRPRVVSINKKVSTPPRVSAKKAVNVGVRGVLNKNKKKSTATRPKKRTVKGATPHIHIKPKF
jgi:hypothetical protein